MVGSCEGPYALTEKNGSKVESRVGINSRSPGDSDMDMEDDITLPDDKNRHSLDLQTADESRRSLENLHHRKGTLNKPGSRSTVDNLNLDEFGRLVREGVTDSDSSESPRKRHGRISRKRNRSQSISRSPSPRTRRRRAPWQREENQQRYLRKRNRSRSPVPWRYSGGRMKHKPGQLRECFNFRRGRCYYGDSCRFLHQVSDRSGTMRYTRGQERYLGSPRGSSSPGSRRSSFHSVSEVKDGQVEYQHDLPISDGAEVSKEQAESSSNLASGKLVSLEPRLLQASDEMKRNNISTTSIHSEFSRKGDYVGPEACAPNFRSSPRIVDKYESPIACGQARLSSVPLNSHLQGHAAQQSWPDPQDSRQSVVPILDVLSHSLVKDATSVFLCQPQTAYPGNALGNDHARPEDVAQKLHFGRPMQNLNASHSSSQGQCNSALMQPLMNGSHNILVCAPPSDSKSSLGQPNLQQIDCGMRYNAGPEIMGMFRITPEFGQANQHDVNNFAGSGIPLHVNPPVPAVDPPLSSNFSFNTLIGENESGGFKFSAPISLSSAPQGVSKSSGVSETLISSVVPGSLDMAVSQRPGADKYDPLLDSIEPASTSFSRVIEGKNEAVGNSDDRMTLAEPGRSMDMGTLEQEWRTNVSVNISSDIEEYGRVEVGADLNASSSNPNDAAIDMKVGESEVDQVKDSGKDKSNDSRSVKLFKSSIATFVKEILKPSWRQGNMSNETFKTIVKKTVDKVSGAIRRQKIPKSQAKIDRYIDSARGKITKLVMGYVDKYVKV